MSESFERELQALINKYSLDNSANTPDFILAVYLSDCLTAWSRATKGRDGWFKFGRQRDRVLSCEDSPKKLTP